MELYNLAWNSDGTGNQVSQALLKLAFIDALADIWLVNWQYIPLKSEGQWDNSMGVAPS